MASSSSFLLFLSLSLFWCASSSLTLLKAVAVLSSNQGVRGTIYFTQTAHPGYKGRTAVTGNISGLKAGLHGFHVHVYGNLTDGCTSAGPHYNPFNKDHGAPQDRDRHAGDLGNVIADDNGVVNIFIIDNQIPLTGPYSVVGRAIVVHADRDDLGRGGTPVSKTTGNSGARVACGVINLRK